MYTSEKVFDLAVLHFGDFPRGQEVVQRVEKAIFDSEGRNVVHEDP
jgi:hypothetical protein